MTEGFFDSKKFQGKAKRLRMITIILLLFGYTITCLGFGVLIASYLADSETFDLFWKAGILVGGILLFFGLAFWGAGRPFFKPPKT